MSLKCKLDASDGLAQLWLGHLIFGLFLAAKNPFWPESSRCRHRDRRTAIERNIAAVYHNKGGAPAKMLKLDTIQTHKFSIVSKQLEIANVIEMILSAE